MASEYMSETVLVPMFRQDALDIMRAIERHEPIDTPRICSLLTAIDLALYPVGEDEARHERRVAFLSDQACLEGMEAE